MADLAQTTGGLSPSNNFECRLSLFAAAVRGSTPCLDLEFHLSIQLSTAQGLQHLCHLRAPHWQVWPFFNGNCDVLLCTRLPACLSCGDYLVEKANPAIYQVPLTDFDSGKQKLTSQTNWLASFQYQPHLL